MLFLFSSLCMKINVSEFFDSLAERCETDEERAELAKLVTKRREEEERWRQVYSAAARGETASGDEGGLNALPFPKVETPRGMPSSSQFTIEWWADQPPPPPRDANAAPFPLRHFELPAAP